MPLAVPPPEAVIHGTLLCVCHEQPFVVVTETEPLVAAATIDVPVGEIWNAHGTPACVTVNGRPAMVTTAFRCVAPGFASTL